MDVTGVIASLTGRTLTDSIGTRRVALGQDKMALGQDGTVLRRDGRVWPVKLSRTTLELGCNKSVRVRYVIVLGFTKCRGVRLLAIGL